MVIIILSDVIKIVVLTASTNAFLAIGCTLQLSKITVGILDNKSFGRISPNLFGSTVQRKMDLN